MRKAGMAQRHRCLPPAWLGPQRAACSAGSCTCLGDDGAGLHSQVGVLDGTQVGGVLRAAQKQGQQLLAMLPRPQPHPVVALKLSSGNCAAAALVAKP